MGIFLPLTGACTLLLVRMPLREATTGRSILAALRLGGGVGGCLAGVACVREVLGTGALSLRLEGPGILLPVPGLARSPAAAVMAPAGALLGMALLIALARWFRTRRRNP
jgi:Na+-translocating ferredoxin:NAD+ oxidoreductase RnfE subunit